MNWWRWAAGRGCRQNSPPRWCLEPPRKAISWRWNRRPWAQSRPVTPTRPPLFDAGVLGVEFQGRVYKEGRRPGTKPCVTPTVRKMEGRRGDPEGPLFWVQPNDLQHLTRSKGAGSMGSEQSRLHQLQALRGTWGGSPGPSGCCVGWKDPPPSSRSILGAEPEEDCRGLWQGVCWGCQEAAGGARSERGLDRALERARSEALS